MIDHPQLPVGLNQNVAQISIFVIDQVVEDVDILPLHDPAPSVDSSTGRYIGLLPQSFLGGGVLDPGLQRALLASDFALHCRGNGVQSQ